MSWMDARPVPLRPIPHASSQPTLGRRVVWVSERNVYGQNMLYPDCADSRVFADMVRAKTLTHANIADIKRLGYTVRVRGQEGRVL